mgnify:CR=1 FL=1
MGTNFGYRLLSLFIIHFYNFHTSISQIVQMESRVVAPIILHVKRFQSKEDTGLQRSGELSY